MAIDNMDKLALAIGNEAIPVPGGVPTGGLSMLETIIRTSLVLLFIIAIVLALIFLILGGVRWITSGGDPKGVESARKQLTYAIIGLIIVFLGFFIVNLVSGFFNIKLLGP